MLCRRYLEVTNTTQARLLLTIETYTIIINCLTQLTSFHYLQTNSSNNLVYFCKHRLFSTLSNTNYFNLFKQLYSLQLIKTKQDTVVLH